MTISKTNVLISCGGVHRKSCITLQALLNRKEEEKKERGLMRGGI